MEDDSDKQLINFYNKRIKPFIAIFILAFLITSCYMLYQDNKLKTEISKNCGWNTETYKCYCDKGTVTDIELILNSSTYGIGNKLENLNIPNLSIEKQ